MSNVSAAHQDTIIIIQANPARNKLWKNAFIQKPTTIIKQNSANALIVRLSIPLKLINVSLVKKILKHTGIHWPNNASIVLVLSIMMQLSKAVFPVQTGLPSIKIQKNVIQKFQHVQALKFITSLLKNVNAHRKLHSGRVKAVYLAFCLTIGIKIWENVKHAHKELTMILMPKPVWLASLDTSLTLPNILV